MIAINELNGGRAAIKKQIEPRNGRIKQHDDFKDLVDLLSVYSDNENRLEQMQAAINEATLKIVDEHQDEYARLQRALVESEAALELIARRHPDWFATKATLKTPYGSVALKNNPPKLVTANEEVSIVLLQAEGERNREFAAERFLRVKTELNLEGLAELTDAQLKQFRITRVQNDTFTVKAARLDLGKAVKESHPEKN